ncbi:Fungal specific transcription factor [Colletotrichum higginsianum IMI 349063]|uniref:Fungal specific transcription factor n=1 Tax=Colletotrichum higginsianum (strain IMI 349063) TaxID=759273 RepID=A0A1B7Y6T5_COLHI|nr:Fungal specific transcription factor [Colletotrichum higginsianum IMI 349063]OBR07707.1 Fungal specific transcription factor [Colletotrichum higginsianum IMI 349063]
MGGPTEKRPPADWDRGGHVVDRLAQMEQLVKELQDPKTSSGSHQTPSSSSQNPATVSSDAHPASVADDPAKPSPGTKPYYSGAESEATVGTVGKTTAPACFQLVTSPPPKHLRELIFPRSKGSCSLFSAEGIAKIDALVGDNRFSVAVQGLLQRIRRIAPPPNPDPLASSVTYPFPPNNVIMECMTDFFQTLNHDIKLLDEAEVRAAVQAYIYGRPPPGSGWRMALNVILLHTLRKRDWASPTGEYDKYLHNAMCLIPSAILQTPNPMAIGALLSLCSKRLTGHPPQKSSYFIFKAENHTSLSVLAVAVQHILLAGYHHANHPALPAADVLHRRRLFWQAYVLDHDLMLRIGKPPLIADDFLLALPDEFPADGYGVFFYPGDVTLNYFRQQVRLSRIQGRICSRLYFKQHTPSSSSWLEAEIAALDAELHEWRESIPAMIRPQPPSSGLVDADYSRMMSLSVLHFVYFQLVVAVHSAAFRTRALDGGGGDDDGDAESLRPSIAVCVNAARGAISLLNYHQLQHPFTIYLLYQVAWCVDILFVNILEHKTSPQSLQDLGLIRLVLSFFERYDADHQRVASYHIIRALYDVASSVTSNATTPLPALPPMMGTDALADSMPMLSMSASASDLDMAGWEEVSLGGHDWLSAGFLQMADWGLPDDSAAADAGTDGDLDYI